MSLAKELEALKRSALEELGALDRIEALRALEVKYLGRKGVLTSALKSVAKVAAEERPRLRSPARCGGDS